MIWLFIVGLGIFLFGLYRALKEDNASYGQAEGFVMAAIGILLATAAISNPANTFNPELHDCTEWEGDFSKCDLSNPLLAAVSIGVPIQAGDYGMRKIVCHYGFEGEEGTDFSTATTTHNDTCVSWQPKPEEVAVYSIEYNGKFYKITTEQFVQFTNTISYSDYSLSEKLHDCARNCEDNLSCIDVCHSTQRNEFDELWQESVENLNIEAINNEQHCRVDPSDAESCDCVKTESLTKNVTEFRVEKWEIINGYNNFVNKSRSYSSKFNLSRGSAVGLTFASRGDALSVYNDFWGFSKSSTVSVIDFETGEIHPEGAVYYTKAVNAYGKEINRTITLGQTCVEAVPR